MVTQDDPEVTKLRKEIERLTGRVVVSRDVTYLRQRVADLKKRKASGKRMPNAKRPDVSSVVSVSLTKLRTKLLADICKKKKEGVSAVLRDAFDEWCRGNGYRAEIEHIRRLEEADVG